MKRSAVMVCIALALQVTSAQAAGAQVQWPTYFRTGPSKHDRVVAELSRGTVVDVRSCDDQWCLVQIGRTLGYLERAVLDANSFPPSVAPSSSACFNSVQTGYGKGENFRYCPR